jgi:ABC-type transport system involved in multi-copper enzyme maturation permease subunit
MEVEAMFHLMKLELRKFKIQSYVTGAIIASMLILATIILVFIVERETEEEIIFNNYTNSFLIIDTLVRATFIIFGAVLISRLIISEFKERTISILFMYPISRKKLMAQNYY